MAGEITVSRRSRPSDDDAHGRTNMATSRRRFDEILERGAKELWEDNPGLMESPRLLPTQNAVKDGDLELFFEGVEKPVSFGSSAAAASTRGIDPHLPATGAFSHGHERAAGTTPSTCPRWPHTSMRSSISATRRSASCSSSHRGWRRAAAGWAAPRGWTDLRRADHAWCTVGGCFHSGQPSKIAHPRALVALRAPVTVRP